MSYSDPRYRARAVGRTAEEHAALEEMLARRRGGGPARSTSGPSSHRNGVRAVPYALPSQQQQRQQQQQQKYSSSPSPAQVPTPSRDGRSKAQIRADFLGPLFGYTGRHRLRGWTCKGSGWHKKGYRSCGCMWININRGRSYTRGGDYEEEKTLADFVWEVQSECEGTDYSPRPGQDWDLQFRKKSLRQVLVDAEAHGLDEEDLVLRDLMDGGETCYYKVLDENGQMVKEDIF